MERLRLLLIVFLLLAILSGGLLLIYHQASPGQALEISIASPSSKVIVQISGEVKKPGVYKLPSGSRVGDLVEAAGGFTSQAEKNTINLAQKLSDGDKIHVYSAEEASQRVNINTAEPWLLEALPGVGEKTAQKIVESRKKEGPFKSKEELLERGIVYEYVFEKIKDLITY